MKTLAHFPRSCYPIIILLKERKETIMKLYIIKNEETDEFLNEYMFDTIEGIREFINTKICIDEDTVFTVYELKEVGEYCAKVTLDFFPCEEKE